jgi:myosin protein heavy chain
MFVLEQQEYAREEIEWNYMDFGHDLQSTIELIEGSARNPIGILSCLDEECIMPAASDTTFLNKLNQIWLPRPDDRNPVGGSSKYGTIRFTQGFTVAHYAGKVEYRTEGWLDKNKDPLNSNITSVLAGSTSKFVASLFSEFAVQVVSDSNGRRVKSGAFRTVAQRHQEQLTKLMVQLDSTEPHFVRCIVPNRHKQPGKIDAPLVLDQLRCNGVLEGIRIARRGYPNRLPFAEFKQRYEILTPDAFGRGYVDGRVACQAMIDALELDKEVVKLGTTKIFFKVGVLADLQERLDAHLFDVVSRFQSSVRRFVARRQLLKILNRDQAVRTIQKNARIYNELREWPWWSLFTTVQPLLAATRNDLELQRKNAELLFAQERAEREEKERAALEGLRVQLEADKKEIEADLESERQIRMSERAIHERTVLQAQQEVNDLKADIDVIADQLERAMQAQAAADARVAEFKNDYDELAGAVEDLELEKERLREREKGLMEDVKARMESVHRLEKERDGLLEKAGELDRMLRDSNEDLKHSKQRVSTLEAELASSKASEAQKR